MSLLRSRCLRTLAFSLPLSLLLAAAPAAAQDRAQALLQFEGVAARYQAAYAPGAVARGARQQLEPADEAIAGGALKALDAASAHAFDANAAVAAVRTAVAAAGQGGAAPSPAALAAVAHLAKVRADYGAMDDAARADFVKRQQAQPPGPARTALLERMAVADLREIDFSSELLMTAVVKQLARGNAAQFSALPEATLEGAIDSLWSRGVTSTRQRNLLIVAREFERQLTLVWLSALGEDEIAALAAWRGDAQADGEREALVGSYRAEVKAGDTRAIRAVLRAWPR
ncbi:hypothetical protein [Variovorax sp. UC122_21]|uniref:hypothetical protein n=1 Tax=Variovorax sp. UC122_21 TaxID=3374554 RepID=UPI003758043D